MRRTGITIINKARDRLRGRGGFSIAEMLLTIAILLLVSGGVASGIRFGVEQYKKSMALSEAKVLCSTLTSAIQSELGDTVRVRLGGDNKVKAFFSRGNGMCSLIPVTVTKEEDGKVTVSESSDDYGELVLAPSGNVALGNPLLNSKAYSSTYKLGANASIEYDSAQAVFEVTLRVRSEGGGDIVESEFRVIPLNDVKTE